MPGQQDSSFSMLLLGQNWYGFGLTTMMIIIIITVLLIILPFLDLGTWKWQVKAFTYWSRQHCPWISC